MRLCRQALLLAVFAGLAMPAAAQYTTNGAAPSGYTSKPAGATAATATPAAAPARKQVRPSAGQPVFRPRPQEEIPAAADDELPSFEALESKSSVQKEEENLPPPPPPKGEIWVYIADMQYEDPNGATMACDWKVVVQNRTDTKIEEMKLSYQLLDLFFHLYVDPIEAGGSFVAEHASFSQKCPALMHVKPKVGVERCKFGILNGQECASYIIVK